MEWRSGSKTSLCLSQDPAFDLSRKIYNPYIKMLHIRSPGRSGYSIFGEYFCSFCSQTDKCYLHVNCLYVRVNDKSEVIKEGYMNSFQQLIRRPMVFITTLILLSVSAGFFVLSSGVFFSSQVISEKMEQRFVVAAFPTNELIRYSKKYNNSEILYHDTAMFQSERIALSNLSKNPDLVENVYHLSFSCGYSPSVRSMVSAEFPGKYRIYGGKDHPYFRNSVIVAKIKEIGEPLTVKTDFPLIDEDNLGEVHDRQGVRVFVELMTELQEVLSLHPGYEIKDEVRITLHFDSIEEYRNAGLEAGKSFYFVGEYYDTSLARITDSFVSLNIPLENTRWEDYLRMFSDEEIEREKKLAEKHGYPPAVAIIWNEKARRGIPLTEEELKEYYISEFDCYQVIPYEENSGYPRVVRNVVETADMTNHSFPVLGTDYVERMFEFHMGELYLTDGRSFTKQEYDSGEEVCILSEQAAQINGLSVGDKIPLSFFMTAEKLGGILLFNRYPNYVFSHELEDRAELSKASEFRIVGLYRAKNLWNFDFFSVTPNTVFIPNKAMPAVNLKPGYGHFQTIVVKRDAVEEFQNALKDSRIRSSVVSIYDNGYEELKPILKSFRESGLRLMLIASGLCAFLLLLYQLLFVLREKRSVGLMVSLGAGRTFAERKWFTISMIPVVIATVIGLIIGMVFTSEVLHTIYLDSAQGVEISEELSLQFEQGLRMVQISAVIGAVVHIAVYAISIWLIVKFVTKTSPLELLKGK